MDTPHGAIHSWKDFLVQMGTITAGVLIALSFEGVRGCREERALVREARETIALEIADNLKELDAQLAGAGATRANLEGLIELSDALLSTKRPDVRKVDFSVSLSELSSASWQTAERVGALALMDYSEVQRYSKLYSIQQVFVEHQSRTLEHTSAALAALSGDPFELPAKDIEAFRQHMLQLRADIFIIEQLGTRLRDEYRKTLQSGSG